MPTFATAHTFCASEDVRVSYVRCLLIQGYFCAKLSGESRTQQVLMVSKIKIGGNHAFFRDSKAPIWKNKAIHCFGDALV